MNHVRYEVVGEVTEAVTETTPTPPPADSNTNTVEYNGEG